MVLIPVLKCITQWLKAYWRPKPTKSSLLYLQKMDFVAMDVRFLDTLLEVIECGSVAEAARRLHLTAAGVSQRIRSLEDEIGVRLVARSGRTMRPTAAAASILDRARIVQREVRDLKSIAASG